MAKKKDKSVVEAPKQAESTVEATPKPATKPATKPVVDEHQAAVNRIIASFDPEHPPVSYNRPCLVVCVGMGCPHIEKCWKPKPLPTV